VLCPFRAGNLFLWAPGAMPRSITLRLFEAGLYGEDGYGEGGSREGAKARRVGWERAESGSVGEGRRSGGKVCWTKGWCACKLVATMKQSVSVIVWEGGHPEEPGLGIPSEGDDGCQ
jgi:hypothetical protein